MTSNVPRMIHTKYILRRSPLAANKAASTIVDVLKRHLAVYVGECLIQAEEEYRFDHPMGDLTIPCSEEIFNNVTNTLGGL
ncbi:hypothetical protein NMG60_11017863 [Bertholletia excelsa]